MHKKVIDFIVVLVLFLTLAYVSLVLELKPLTGAFLYLFIPSAYLAIRQRKNYKKLLIATVLLGGIFGSVFDFIETLNKAWIVNRLVFTWKIFGILPIDDVIGFFLMTLFIIVFYEHFLDDEKNKKISPYLMFGLAPAVILALFTIVAYLTDPKLLVLPYAYLVGGSIFIIFPIIYSFLRPQLLSKFLKTAAFFFVIWFVSEFVAIETGGWYFPGNYIGKVSVLGVSFPFEELFFWMLLYSASVVAMYERVIDDGK